MSETKIEFDATYQFCWLKNIGTGDCYVSDHPNIVAEDDDVALLPAGEAVRLTVNGKTLYVLGSTTLEVHAQNFSDSPFAWNEAGGGGGSDITVESLTVNENGTYTAPSGTAYSPVTVNVPTGAEIITRSDWNALTTAQKQAKGLVAIQDSTTGFQRGIFVNGADYLPDVEMLYYGSQNATSAVSLSYTVATSGTYQIILNTVHGDTLDKNNLAITVNGAQIQSAYSAPTENNNVAINIYKAEVELDAGDVVSFAFTNTTRYNNAGIQMFVMSNANLNAIELYNSAGNNGATFNIDLSSWYLQVAKTGYYSGGNTFEYHEIDNEPATSVATTSASSYWYGGTYVLRLQ